MNADGYNAEAIGRALGVQAVRIRMYFYRKRSVEYTGPKVILKKSKMDGYVGQTVEAIACELPQFGVRRLAHIYSQRNSEALYSPGPAQINRLLLRKGYVSGFKKRSFGLTPAHKAARVAFAEKWLVDGEETLGNIIWSDETMVRSHPFTRKQRDRWNPSKNETAGIQEMEQGGKNSVMFWGCISKHGAGPLVSLLGNQNGEKYGEIIKDIIIPELRKARSYDPGPWIFMQDNAAVHKTVANKKLFSRARVDVLDWPAKSPDLNPIENVWAWLKEKLYTHYLPCKSAEELEEVVMKIWVEDLTPEMCQRFCGDYAKRLRAVIESEGEATKY